MREAEDRSPADVRRYFIPTQLGEVSLVFAPTPTDHLTVFIHGAARNSRKLAGWLRPGAALIELPGHGVAPFITGGVEQWSAAFQAAISQVWPTAALTLVGESLGGIIALHMRADRVVALDPPMEPTDAVELEIRYGNVAEFLRPMIRGTYWHILDEVDQPVEIVCATNGILPTAARRKLREHQNVQYSEITGGHLLLDENVDYIATMLGGYQQD